MAKNPTPAPAPAEAPAEVETQANATARTPVEARGHELLSLIAATEPAEGEEPTDDKPGFLMLTEAEGMEAVTAGYATVNMAVTNDADGTAAVSLTEAGRAQLASTEGAGASGSAYEIESDVEMPGKRARRGKEASYPFDMLEVGQSFHVAKTAENPDPAQRLASSVSGARAKYAVPTGETETVDVPVYKREGKEYVKGADGKRVVERVEQKTRPATRLVRDFSVFTVDEKDKKGPGARVFRTK